MNNKIGRGSFAGMFAALVGAPLLLPKVNERISQGRVEELMSKADEMDILTWDRMGVCNSIRLGFPGGMLTNSESRADVVIVRQEDLSWKVVGDE